MTLFLNRVTDDTVWQYSHCKRSLTMMAGALTGFQLLRNFFPICCERFRDYLDYLFQEKEKTFSVLRAQILGQNENGEF